MGNERAATAAGLDGYRDDHLSERFPVYTRGNIGEVMPEPISPLHNSLLDVLDAAQRSAFCRMGVYAPDEFDDDIRLTYPIVNGYAYLNLSVFRIVGVRVEGLTPELIDEAIATSPDLPPYRPHPDDENAEAGARMGETLQWAISVADLPEVDDAEARVDELRRIRGDLTALSVPELIARYRELNVIVEEHWARHLYISFCRAFPYGLIALFFPSERATPTEVLEIAGGADLESAAPAMGLWELSRLVAASAVLGSMFADGIDGLPERLATSDEPDVVAFGEALEEFCREFGYRGVAETNLYVSTWETEPETVLGFVDRMRLMPDDQSPVGLRRAQATRGAARIDELVGGFDDDTSALVRAAAIAARTLDAGRERCKANAVKVTHEQRMVLHELGRRFVRTGALDRPQDICMVRDDEMEEFVADPASFADRIAARREHYEHLRTLDPPFVFEGGPPPPESWGREAPAPEAAAGDVLVGVSGSLGIATGRARVIREVEECGAFEPGDILVAPMTDAAWTPLFVPAAAVVTEIGGTASHAIIVARELGIPCVSSVTGATERIPDGATITVDGLAGTVTVV